MLRQLLTNYKLSNDKTEVPQKLRDLLLCTKMMIEQDKCGITIKRHKYCLYETGSEMLLKDGFALRKPNGHGM